MIPDEVVDEVRARVDLVAVIGEVVALERSGKDWKGKCPFHDDRTPSFYVVPEKGFYTCFGCGESGDIFNFLMKRNGMAFLDTVRHLGERFGVVIPEARAGADEQDPHRLHYEANAFARQWFREQLVHPEEGATAREYLVGRGIDAEVWERFGLGFAPDAWRGFRDAASKHEISEQILLEVGLLTTSERSREPYDRFRNRIIFPIESVSGRVVAFGGRILSGEGQGAPKYLNSPESFVYHKGRVLYGLGWNRHSIRKEGVALVVEGYMDVVALGSVGVDHAVATLGTAMTDEHARLLSRYTGNALLLFDSDEAGLRATFRAADVLLAHGVHPSVVTLPPGEDPDTIVRTQGTDGLERYLGEAVDVLDRKLQLMSDKAFFDSVEGIRLAVDKVLPTLRAVRDPALRDIYVARVAERTGVRRKTLEDEVARQSGGGGHHLSRQGRLGTSDRTGGSRPRPAGSRVRLEGMGAERQFLLVLLRSRSLIDRALERIGPEEFRDPAYRAIFEALVEDPDLQKPSVEMSPDVAIRLVSLLGDPQEMEHTQRAFEESLAFLQDRPLQLRQAALERDLREAGSEELKRTLLEESARLRKERRGQWNVVRREGPVGMGENDRQVDE